MSGKNQKENNNQKESIFIEKEPVFLNKFKLEDFVNREIDILIQKNKYHLD